MPDEFGERNAGSAVEPCPFAAQQQPEHWIEIELVGEDDKPIPWVAYKVRLPDGTPAEGYLDETGFARVERIPQSGQCSVSFPELDKEAWTLIEIAGPRSS